jgi:hypothetical protein
VHGLFTEIYHCHFMILCNKTYESIIYIQSEENVHYEIVGTEFATFPL